MQVKPVASSISIKGFSIRLSTEPNTILTIIQIAVPRGSALARGEANPNKSQPKKPEEEHEHKT
jgi:hypothetical protein